MKFVRGTHPAPRSGEGGPRFWRGGRGVGGEANLSAVRPLHHASHGPPPPLRFTTRGRKSRHREEPTGPARSGRPDDKLRDEAIQTSRPDWIASLGSQ